MENGTCWFIENTKRVWLIGILPCSVWWCDFIETKLIIEKLDCKKQTKCNRIRYCLSASIVQYGPWTLKQNLAWECLSHSNDIVVSGGKFWVDAWTNYMLITLFYKGNILKRITNKKKSKQSKNLWKGFNIQVLISRSFSTNLSKECCHSALECVCVCACVNLNLNLYSAAQPQILNQSPPPTPRLSSPPPYTHICAFVKINTPGG